jgi:insertion element IS1 protein InsB
MSARKYFFSIVNGSETRAAAGTLGTAKGAVAAALKSIEALLWHVNCEYPNRRRDGDITVEFVPVNEAETDEMRGFAGDKSRQYWLWQAVIPKKPLAFHFGAWEHKNLDELLALLKPFDIKVVCSDNSFACRPRVSDGEAITGKENTRKIERKHLSLRTWCSHLARKGSAFFQRPSYAQNRCRSRY